MFDFTDYLLSDDYYDYDSIVQHSQFADSLLINGEVAAPLDDCWVALDALDHITADAVNYRSPWAHSKVWKSVPRLGDEIQFLRSTHDVTCALFIGLTEVMRFKLLAGQPYAISVPLPAIQFHAVDVLADRECHISAYTHYWPNAHLRDEMCVRRQVSTKLECMFWDGMGWPFWTSKDDALLAAVEGGCNIKG